ncbi:MAG: periplasmic heavy metal sensor [Candidatus Margulisbacteria bacterium]|nr:periplasmic heavy metal sensor [Candidatus Margulisiibacteriota bacterium]
MKKIILILMVLVMFSATSFAADIALGKSKFEKSLGLNTEQTEKLQAHREQSQKITKELRDELRAKHKALAKAIGQKTIDQAEVNQIAAEIKDLQGKMVDQKIASMLEMKNILTEEQFKKMQEQKENRKGKEKEDRKQGTRKSQGIK